MNISEALARYPYNSTQWKELDFESEIDLKMVLFLSPASYGIDCMDAILVTGKRVTLFNEFAKNYLLFWHQALSEVRHKESKTTPGTGGARAVYFLFDDLRQSIKIGTSLCVKQRIKDLQMGTSANLQCLKTIKGGREKEHQLHKKFAHLHIRGEWFRATSELISFIEGC
ncbi:MAG: GIY-YIG nuclease family protein [Stenomitos rutilans HA7619-LM2]|jgi:hypothetical protein|nr:GIY-YIG nuclease family protein [Stenomitos rutilans HA7619-LM2]MBW4469385.1 GIY-YIG nuclease family protein [Stenomitos rutilans HA7619-LM2]